MADNTAFVKSIYDAFAKGDVGTVLGSLDPKVEWNEAEHFPYWPGHAFIGADAIVKGVFSRLANDWDGFRVEVKRIVGLGDTVLSELRYHGTAKKTGKKLDAQVAHVWDVKNGKVVKFQQYADTWLIAQVAGITPQA
jgi:ketosteroid isomerase-like protein